ncbi:glycosyltransferase family 2 protein [Aetokthonos hydrillicola Thurmond2011]|jgi:rhamnosyltransferase|uniref:Glycosyltransferase family 2 protein n=1 Tax=Aetokthonos hydrillicola Thurmond2011 TaxID=2712845 RepID=A0AAP5IB55_9CYAN|nr:glycosyltransferase family 2 protein [Aetokthonos hydrillicola]MBO3463326.1 glycosyltransferase family 2 protein [Aetokthonos hydrillicola CCALA 1050]MBW4586795.1 glycosyltransferase family 2 protein [Aetokthonos hydrillicola CCALA 1050]MDR9895845.1 glycosyltransferase family 2 protein [Aetokthonos hydrillicola Thurmond2011]
MIESIYSKVAAYITAYNDLEALDKTINAIQRQSYPVIEIFIVDNSKTELVTEDRYKNTVVEFHPENLGVAGGLKIAINWATEKGYDFLWLFDQDSEPEPDVLEKLLVKHQELSHKGEKIGIISPVIIDINTKQEFAGCVFLKYKLVPIPGCSEIKDFYKCDAVITSGSLVNLSSAKHVEPPIEELFLDAVDYAYCMNFRKKEYEIIVVKDTIMKHRVGNYSKVKDRLIKGNNEVITFVCSPSRYYYACRNHTFFETRTAEKAMLYRSVIYRTKLLIDMITRIIRYEPDLVLLKIWACILGTFDGFIGKLGKTW